MDQVRFILKLVYKNVVICFGVVWDVYYFFVEGLDVCVSIDCGSCCGEFVICFSNWIIIYDFQGFGFLFFVFVYQGDVFCFWFYDFVLIDCFVLENKLVYFLGYVCGCYFFCICYLF